VITPSDPDEALTYETLPESKSSVPTDENTLMVIQLEKTRLRLREDSHPAPADLREVSS
jgi:hypothetical protein